MFSAHRRTSDYEHPLRMGRRLLQTLLRSLSPQFDHRPLTREAVNDVFNPLRKHHAVK